MGYKQTQLPVKINSLLNYPFYFIMTNSEKDVATSDEVSPVGGPHKGELGILLLYKVDKADHNPESEMVPFDIL